jgi:predicted GH43/DUF377 family glycosyl hydrolase
MYIMSYFTLNSQSFFLAKSPDLLNWEKMFDGKYLLTGETEPSTIIRDPFIILDKEGMYHLLFTNNWNGNTIGHSTSTDLANWSKQEYIEISKGLAVGYCWAPECIYDYEKENYIIIWSSYINNSSKICCSTTKDFITFSEAKVFFDPGYDVIDASIKYVDGTYYMAFKDERGNNEGTGGYKAIRTCYSKSAMGPYSEPTQLLTECLSEGPCLARMKDNWFMFYDFFGVEIYKAKISKDFISWTDITDKMSFPEEHIKHVSIMEIEG